jgi:hypothetical protein
MCLLTSGESLVDVSTNFFSAILFAAILPGATLFAASGCCADTEAAKSDPANSMVAAGTIRPREKLPCRDILSS